MLSCLYYLLEISVNLCLYIFEEIMALTPPTDQKMRLEFLKSIKPDAEIQTTCD